MNYLLIDERVWHDLQMHVRRIEEKMRMGLSDALRVAVDPPALRYGHRAGYLFARTICPGLSDTRITSYGLSNG